ncbi:PREDICTED: uncharacterized protein LOC105130842 isoform X2 [Populus euphratica]|uniref:Uncharacterized protein LOC105130842 isoform X2 n=1 Tax=Populus euphratica TaxID=75702 RepID=A0AAJ6UN28_POPEU|nr:PREDICTED: uncharacterized protein LOC105130842 isoform X2 [Populus euphratica]
MSSFSLLHQVINIFNAPKYSLNLEHLLKHNLEYWKSTQKTSEKVFMAAATSTPTEFEENRNDDDKSEMNIANYLIVSPEKGGILDLIRYMVWADMGSGVKFLESSEERIMGGEAADHRWIILVSIIVRKIISLFGKPMEYTGFVADFFLNLLFQNGGIMGLFLNFLQGKVMTPQRDTETFISTIGHLDGRIDLYRDENLLEQLDNSVSAEKIATEEIGNRALMDLCIMASKLAYENAKVVQSIVVQHWKMHFVDFYNCWNDFQKEMSTQVFILCDKPKDANLILISFRGTELFDADDWVTDFDYSWYEIPKLGRVHMGFLEALGLGNRADTTTFHNHLQTKSTNFNHGYDAYGSLSSNTDSDMEENVGHKKLLSEKVKKTAYYAMRKKLKSILMEHKNAKFVVTGHSLGGALAVLFPTMLVLHQQTDIMKRLLGVYTFGQPRIGNLQLAKFMEAHLEYPVPKYFRVVYSYDLVPRLPCDDKTFLYKHFGVCLYYNSLYIEQKLDEEPDPNFYGLRNVVSAHLNSVWELIRSFVVGYTYGPMYKESWLMVFVRIMGLALPGIAAHGPTDYVNSVRLGKERIVRMSSFREVSAANDAGDGAKMNFMLHHG